MVGKPLQLLVLFLVFTTCSACGYLDEEIWLEEEQFGQALEMEGIGIRGSGHSWGCGGVVRISRRARVPYRHSAYAGLMLDPMYIYAPGTGAAGSAALTDQQILESTDVEVIDETPVAGSVEAVYYETKATRDEAIVTHYTSGS